MGIFQSAFSPEAPRVLEKVEDWRSKNWELRTILEQDTGFQLEISRREGFSATAEIHRRKGPAIEVAGPTDPGFFFHEFSSKEDRVNKVDLFKEKPAFVSNIYPGKPEFDPVSGKFMHFRGQVDFIADARKLPIKDENVELLYCSCLGVIAAEGVQSISASGAGHAVPKQKAERIKDCQELLKEAMILRQQTITEAWRVLMPGGLLIWYGGKVEDLNFALRQGFIILQNEKTVFNAHSNYDVIFMKEIKK